MPVVIEIESNVLVWIKTFSMQKIICW